MARQLCAMPYKKTEEQAEFIKQIRDVLAHLYDTAYLESHPLGLQLIGAHGSSHLTRAQELRKVLKDTIETLRPRQGHPTSEPKWRSYLALYQRYVQEMSFLEVQQELGISRRQLQRELRKGLETLATLLWKHRQQNEPAVSSEQAGEVEAVQQELSQWQVNRQICQVPALVEDVRWLLCPLLDQQQATLEVDLPASLAPVLADPTLTRQVLFRILRLLIQGAGQGRILLRARVQAQTIIISLQAEKLNISEAAEDWQIAGLMISRQGGRLRREVENAAAPTVEVSLAVATQARVLVVDDVEAVHRLFERHLSPHNYEVMGATSGPEALQLAAELQPNLIILDLMMPTVDGWQVLRELKENPATARIPVIICSVLKEPEIAMSLGAAAFVKKPVARLELLATLERIRGAAASE